MTAMIELKALHDRYVMPTYAPSLALVSGRGTRVTDANGKSYLDFASGIAVNNLGHCHPAVVEAIRLQTDKVLHVSNLFVNENQPRLAERISAIGLGGKVFFCNSGAEANEALVKLARLHGSASGRYEIITMRNSFHGRTLATMTATGQTKYQKGFEPLVPGFVYADFNDFLSVRAAATPRTAAVLVEAVQGEGGILPASFAFMDALRRWTREQGILLLVDEVQSGIGRTGAWFAWQHYGIRPDGFSMAKALGGGLPIGAAAVTPELSDTFHPGNHASTFGGNPVATAAALAVLDTIENEKLLERATQAGITLMDSLRAFVPHHPCIETVRGIGLMIGLVLDIPAAPVAAALREAGLLVIPTGEHVLRLVPPLTVSDAEIVEALAIIDGILP